MHYPDTSTPLERGPFGPPGWGTELGFGLASGSCGMGATPDHTRMYFAVVDNLYLNLEVQVEGPPTVSGTKVSQLEVCLNPTA